MKFQNSGRSSKAETERRVNEVVTLLLLGVRSGQIVQNVSQKYKISDRQVANLISKATAEIVEAGQAQREEALARAIVGRDELLQRAWQAKQYKTCLAIMESRDRLLGLYYCKDEPNSTETTEATIVILPAKD
jgi:hypothetical protein